MKKAIKKCRFTPLDKVIAKRLKNEQFRKSFSEEMSRLRVSLVGQTQGRR